MNHETLYELLKSGIPVITKSNMYCYERSCLYRAMYPTNMESLNIIEEFQVIHEYMAFGDDVLHDATFYFLKCNRLPWLEISKVSRSAEVLLLALVKWHEEQLLLGVWFGPFPSALAPVEPILCWPRSETLLLVQQQRTPEGARDHWLTSRTAGRCRGGVYRCCCQPGE